MTDCFYFCCWCLTKMISCCEFLCLQSHSCVRNSTVGYIQLQIMNRHIYTDMFSIIKMTPASMSVSPQPTWTLSVQTSQQTFLLPIRWKLVLILCRIGLFSHDTQKQVICISVNRILLNFGVFESEKSFYCLNEITCDVRGASDQMWATRWITIFIRYKYSTLHRITSAGFCSHFPLKWKRQQILNAAIVMRANVPICKSSWQAELKPEAVL